MSKQAKITAILLVLALAGSVSAEVITVQVTGVVDGVDTHGGLALDGSVDIGSAMTGFTTYDTETPDLSDGSNGRYAVISISMTVGNYTFTHDPTSSTSALFEVRILSSHSYSYGVRSHDPRFDGTIYIDGSPKTFDEVNLDPFGLHLMKLVDPDSIITDELPDLDSWPDFSTFTSERFFGVGVDSPPEEPGFAIWGELTSLTVIPEPAKTYYVNAAEGSDDNDGLSSQTAFATIQKAIDSAFDGDTVIVADGTYTGPGNRDIDFLGKAITVRSESGPENCIIDCNGSEEEYHRGFTFHNGEDANSVLEGFTITNGYASGPWPQNNGGGIFGDGASPTIANCKVTGNTADYYGGGAYWKNNSNPKLINCEFTENTAGSGGGVYCLKGNPTIDNCVISRNSAVGQDHGWSFGGGLFIVMSGGAITNCTITNNSSVDSAGGISCFSCGVLRITNCTIIGNSAREGGGIHCMNSSPTIAKCKVSENFTKYGGGIMCDGGSPRIISSVVSGNRADFRGGGIYCGSRSVPEISNSTIVGNWTNGDAGGIYSYAGSHPIVVNCILWGNEAPNGPELYLAEDSNALVNYTDAQGGQTDVYVEPGGVLNWDSSNIDLDPCFVQPGYWADANDPNIIVEPNDPNAIWVEGDYHLLRTSPCVDAAFDANVYTDIEGNVRPFDFPGVDNNGELPEFDMGAYEIVPVEAAMKLTPQMLNCNSKGKYVKAHLTLPEEFSPEDVDINESAMAEPIGIESEYIKVLGAGIGLVKLEVCFDREAFCAQITETGEVEITVIGSLTTGQYFSATDTIRIKPRR